MSEYARKSQSRKPTPPLDSGQPMLNEDENHLMKSAQPDSMALQTHQLQHAVGNQATMRMLQRTGRQIQREATKETIADKLNKAMDGWGSDEGKILEITSKADDTEKQEVLKNPVLVKRLASELSRGAMLKALKNLNAPLAQRLHVAMDGWGADEKMILQITKDANDDQKKELLKDTDLIKRLKSELSRDHILEALANLKGPLAERLYVAMDGWGADAKTILQITKDADDTQKKDLLKDTGLVKRLSGELSREQILSVLSNLKAPLDQRLNTAMDGWGADETTILQITKDADDTQKKDLLKNTTLIARLKGEMSRANMISVLSNLKAPLVDRINVALEGWGSDAKAVVSILTSASNTEFQALTTDTAMVSRLSEMPEIINNPALSSLFVKAMAKPTVDIDKSVAIFVLSDAFSSYTTIKGGNVKLLSQSDFEKAWDDIYGKDDYKNNTRPKLGNLEGFAHGGINYINQGNTSVDTVHMRCSTATHTAAGGLL